MFLIDITRARLWSYILTSTLINSSRKKYVLKGLFHLLQLRQSMIIRASTIISSTTKSFTKKKKSTLRKWFHTFYSLKLNQLTLCWRQWSLSRSKYSKSFLFPFVAQFRYLSFNMPFENSIFMPSALQFNALKILTQSKHESTRLLIIMYNTIFRMSSSLTLFS